MGSSANAELVYGIITEPIDFEKEEKKYDEEAEEKKFDILDKLKVVEFAYGNSVVGPCGRGICISDKDADFNAWEEEPCIVGKLNAKPEWDEELKKACGELGVKYQKPQWILSVWYG